MIDLANLKNRGWENHGLTGLFIAFIAFLVYANSLANGFVTDDPGVILNNPVLRGTPLSLFNTIDTTSDTQLLPFYRPLTYLTFYAEGQLHGFNPALMHLVNVLLHAANAFLVYGLARSLFSRPAPALLVGLLFAVHPLHTEGVNFIAGGRNTMLACLFCLAAYLVQRRSIAERSSTFALTGGMLFLAGLLSKESAMMVLPFILFQETAALRERGADSRFSSVIRLAPYAAATAGYLVLRWMTLSRLGIQASIIPGAGSQKLQDMYEMPGLAERLVNNLYIIPKYLSEAVWPLSLSPRYAIPGDLHLIALPLIAGWLCIFAVLFWLLTRGRSRATLFGLFWLLAFWMPVSGIFSISTIQMADRYLYLPAIGLWIIAADQAERFSSTGKAALRYVVISSGIILLVMAALTVRRNLDWKSDLTLFTRLVEQYPDNPHGHLHLGTAYLKRMSSNDLQLAEKEFEMVLALDPSTQAVQTRLGRIRLETGDFEGAVYYYSAALGFYPLDREARINRGVAYEKLGRYKEALADYQFYLTIPGYNTIPGSQEFTEAKVRELSRY